MNPNCCRNSKPQIKHGDWQRERASRLHLQFQRVEARAKGKSVKSALQHFCWYWRGEHYRSNPRIKVQFSVPRLRNLYYIWRAKGRTPQAVAFRYNHHRKAAPNATQINRFLDCCRDSLTMAGAFRLAAIEINARLFFGCVSAELRAIAREMTKANRTHRAALRRFAASRVKLERRAA